MNYKVDGCCEYSLSLLFARNKGVAFQPISEAEQYAYCSAS